MSLGSGLVFLASSVRPEILENRFKVRDWLFSSVALPFNMQHQTQSNWCWAATATSTSIFYNPTSTWTQCTVANAELNLTNCCNSPVPGPCNVPWYLDRALTRTGNYVSLTGPISFDAVSAELQAGRVLGARVGWAGGGGHFMVIYGCGTANGVQYFNIDDPIYGKSTPSVATFTNSYQGSGRWTTTYYTKAAPLTTPIRPIPIRPDILKKIWEARPLVAAAASGAAGGAESLDQVSTGVSFGLAHPVHVLGLRDLVGGGAGGAASEQPVALRVIESRGGGVTGFYDVSPEGEPPSVLQMASADNPYGQLIARGVEVAGHYAEQSGSEMDMRLLRIPALYVEALVLRPDRGGEEVAIVLRAPHPDVPQFEPIPLPDLLSRLAEPARTILDADDGLIGS